MSRDPLRVALIGYGFAGRTFHAPLIRSTAGLSLGVVVSRDASKVVPDMPGVPVLATPEAAFAQADVDLVVLATPNASHAPLAIAALEAGKHVVVDKPFTVTLAEAKSVVMCAAKRDRLVSVFQNRRWDGDFLALRALVAEGVLGEVVHFESRFDRYRPEVRSRWREQVGPGSGLWLDLGPHLVDQALQLFGSPRGVLASLASQRAGAVTDDWAHVLLDYGRLRVILNATLLAAGGSPRMIVNGTKGSWVKYGLDVQESQLLEGLRPGDPRWGADPIAGRLYVGGNPTPVDRPVPRGDYGQYYARVRDAIRGTGANPVPPSDAIAVMTVLEATLTSAREDRVVLLGG